MRCSLQFLLSILLVQSVLAIVLWSAFKSYVLFDEKRFIKSKSIKYKEEEFYNNVHDKAGLPKIPSYEQIDCNINGEYIIQCRTDGDEVYLPFQFIERYFEVYGKLTNDAGLKRFDWSHSYATVYFPKQPYNSRGVFTHFQNYKVEERDRVKCLTASEGVPLSTQWNSRGYYYPTQIAQYGLSHYSKNLTEPKPIITAVNEIKNITSWLGAVNSKLKVANDITVGSDVLKFGIARGKNITVKCNYSSSFHLDVDLKLNFANKGAFIVTILSLTDNQIYNLQYDCSNRLIDVQGNTIIHGMKCTDEFVWKKLNRDLLIDIQKGIMFKTKVKLKIARSSYTITAITLKGSGAIDNLTLATSDHMAQFYAAVKWFVKYQDNLTGGWANPVARRMSGIKQLNPGWYSAMGQGHGMSLLARAYHHSGGDKKYLLTALKSLRPFQKSSKTGGVLAMYLDRIPWYEEYPTNPPTLVLNGFIYSLIGLYDLMSILPRELSTEVQRLYNQGMDSLKTLLLAYDTGSGSTYDLRHHATGKAPLLARWDYHAIHVNQLLLLSTIDKSEIISSTAKRWHSYMTGVRASHN